MKKILILLLFPCFIFSQQWQQTYDVTGHDYAKEVQQTFDGGYIIIGYGPYPSGSTPARLIKTDLNGDVQWEQTFTGDGYFYGWSVDQTSDGGYIITGMTNGEMGLIKTNDTGNLEWEQTFGGDNLDYARSVKQASDGGYIVSGHTLSDSGIADFYLVKTDATGNLEWEQTFGGVEYESNYYVEQTSDGGFILTGDTYSELTNNDFYLVKTDPTGNLEWEQTLGGSNYDVAREVHQTTDGGYILVGYTESYGCGNRSAYIIKTDSLGNMQWEQTFGGSNEDYFLSGKQTLDGGYILTGYTQSFGLNNHHLYLVKTDEIGNMQWQQIFGDTIGQSWGESVIQTNDGGFAICGFTGSYTNDNATWLVKVDSLGNHIPGWWNGSGCPNYGCTDETAFNYNPDATEDDGSCIIPFSNLPDSLSTCDSVQVCVDLIDGASYSWTTSNLIPFLPEIGDSYGGGTVFYLDGNGGGFVASPFDNGVTTGPFPDGAWGCTYCNNLGGSNSFNVPGADGTAIGTGYQNTIDIVAGYTEWHQNNGTGGTNAAFVCDNLTLGGYSDWYLPSKDELSQLLSSGIGGFNGNYYWSSSEYNSSQAWCHGFNNPIDKFNTYKIRAIRTISSFLSPAIDTTNCVWVSNSGWNYITITTDDGFTATDSVYVDIITNPCISIFCGDVNLDEQVNSQDAALILQFIVGLIDLDEEQIQNGDVNNDDSLNSQDAALILQYIVGLIDEFPGCE